MWWEELLFARWADSDRDCVFRLKMLGLDLWTLRRVAFYSVVGTLDFGWIPVMFVLVSQSRSFWLVVDAIIIAARDDDSGTEFYVFVQEVD